MPDGTVIWTLPDGQTYITVAGSALLFPSLMSPTGVLPEPRAEAQTGADRTRSMPLRKTTRAANRAHRIATERAHNRSLRTGLPTDDPPL